MKRAMSVVTCDHVPCWNIKTAKKQDEKLTKKSNSKGTQKEPKTAKKFDSEDTQKELKIAKKQDEEPIKKFNCEGTQKEHHTIVCAIPMRMMHTRLRRKQSVSHAWVLAGLGATPKAMARPTVDDVDVDVGQAIHNLMRELFPSDSE